VKTIKTFKYIINLLKDKHILYNIMTSTCKRHGNKWTHNEVLALQREYELLEWDIQKIADKHERSVQSIIQKLFAEEITPTLLVDPSVIAKPVTNPLTRSCKTNEKINISEDVVEEFSDADSDYEDCCEDEEDEDEDEVEDKELDEVETSVNNLSDRVWSLETSVSQISSMVKQMFEQMTGSSKKSTRLSKA